MRQIATAIDRIVVPPAPCNYIGITFSRDGSYLYFVRADAGDSTGTTSLYQVSVLGGDPRKILDHVPSPITLSPDGSRVAFIRGDPAHHENDVMIARIDGAEVKKLAARPWTSTYGDDGPAWSPDGKRIVVEAVGLDTGDMPFLVEVNTQDGSEKRIGSGSWGAVSQVAWLPDGTGLLMAAADEAAGWFFQLWFVPYPLGEPRKISADPNNYSGMSVSVDGRVALTLQSDWLSTIWTAPKNDPQRAAPITDGKFDGFSGLAWAGGNTIVFGTRDWDIWSVGADGRNRKLLTVGENNNRWPCVPRDGRAVFFESWRNDVGAIWRMDIDGGNVRLVVKERGGVGQISCTPDGQWLLYPTGSGMRRVRFDGTSSAEWSGKVSGPLAVSPDGTRIAGPYYDAARSKMVINVIPFQGGEAERTFDVPPGTGRSRLFLRWTPDGRALSYIATTGETSNIWIQPIAGGPPRQWTTFKEDQI